MTQDEIIETAVQAGMYREVLTLGRNVELLTAFAKLVAQHERERIKAANAPEIERINAHIKELENAVLAEREACANVCINIAHKWTRMGAWGTNNEYHECANAIRARGQA